MFKPLLAPPHVLPHVDMQPPHKPSSAAATETPMPLAAQAAHAAAGATTWILASSGCGVDAGNVLQPVAPIEVQPCVQMSLAAVGAPLVSHIKVER